MSWMELVDRLAGVAGLEPWYYDIKGARHETTIESKVLVLSALGFDVSSIGAAGTSLSELEEEPWRRIVSPFAVTQASSRTIDLFVPVDRVHRLHGWQMRVDGGEAVRGEFRPDALPLLGAREIDGRRIEHRRLTFDARSTGYHRFTIEADVGSSRVDLQACKLEYSIVSPK